MNFKAFAWLTFVGAAAGTLGACESNRAARERNPAPCPNIVVLSDAARALEFDGEPSADALAFTAEIEDAEISCRYFADKPIEAEIVVDFAFGRGPSADAARRDFTYFVAVARRDLEVIAKQDFLIPVSFDDDESVVRVSEEIDRITIPRRDENVSGVNFEVIVGLSLTREQALYNRSGQSLKFPDLQ